LRWTFLRCWHLACDKLCASCILLTESRWCHAGPKLNAIIELLPSKMSEGRNPLR
jgi:hypothetical protein